MRRVVQFWNLLASIPTGHLFARVARGDCLLNVTTRSPTWAGSVMKALRDIGYPYPIDALSLHPVDFAAIKALLRARAQLCSYHRWFRRPAHLPRLALLFLPTPVSHLRVPRYSSVFVWVCMRSPLMSEAWYTVGISDINSSADWLESKDVLCTLYVHVVLSDLRIVLLVVELSVELTSSLRRHVF
jgi:hypothetical protein